MQVYIQWHEGKRGQNLREHGIDFAGLTEFFDGELLTQEDARYPYPELRFQSIGMRGCTALLVVWTPLDADCTALQLISARKATHDETQNWFEYFSTKN